MSFVNIPDRTTDDLTASSDINQLMENLRALAGNGTLAPTSDIKTLNDWKDNFTANVKTELHANGSAPIYACRAWVNFCSIPLTGTYSQSGTTVTVTITNHGMQTGMKVNVTPTSGTGVAGHYIITYINANSYSYTAGTSLTTSGNITQNLYIRASGNIATITDEGVGQYVINFTTPMEDTNYNVSITGSGEANSYVTVGYIMSASGTPLYTVNSVRIHFCSPASYVSKADQVFACVSIFR